MKLKIKTDALLYTVSLAETDNGNFLKLSTYNSRNDKSIFLFDITSGKLTLSHIDTAIKSHKQFYKKLIDKPNINLSQFIENCMANKIMIAYSEKEAQLMFAEKPPSM